MLKFLLARPAIAHGPRPAPVTNAFFPASSTRHPAASPAIVAERISVPARPAPHTHPRRPAAQGRRISPASRSAFNTSTTAMVSAARLGRYLPVAHTETSPASTRSPARAPAAWARSTTPCCRRQGRLPCIAPRHRDMMRTATASRYAKPVSRQPLQRTFLVLIRKRHQRPGKELPNS